MSAPVAAPQVQIPAGYQQVPGSFQLPAAQPQVVNYTAVPPGYSEKGWGMNSSGSRAGVAFVVTFIIVWGLIYLARPSWALNEPDENGNQSVSLGYSAGAALLAAVIIAILAYMWKA